MFFSKFDNDKVVIDNTILERADRFYGTDFPVVQNMKLRYIC